MASEFSIPNEILDGMACMNCREHLSIFPINIKNDGTGAVCGRCKILNQHEFIHNEIYEGLAKIITFPCRYARNGCHTKLKPPELEQHERCCEFRIFECPNKVHLKCQWKGVRANLVEHFEQSHSRFLLQEPLFKLNFENSHIECFLFRISNQLFIVKNEIDCDKRIFSCSIEHLKATEDLDVYKYLLNIENGKGHYSYKCPEKSTCNNKRLNTTVLTYDVLQERLFYPTVIIVKIQLIISEEDSSTTSNGTAAATSQTIDLKKNPKINWDVLSEMECPVCYNYLLAPIYQCINGHSICRTCKSQLYKCPVCKCAFQENRNLVLEKMTLLMEYPCQYYKFGCFYSCQASEIEKHEKRCEFGPYSCPLKEAPNNCDWVASFAEVSNHIDNVHDELILSRDKVETTFNNSQSYEKLLIIKFLSKIFIFIHKYENKRFFWCVQLLGNADDSKLYKFEVDVIDLTSDGKRCNFTGLVVPLSAQNEYFTRMGKYTVASLEQLESFITDDRFSFNIRIFKDDIR